MRSKLFTAAALTATVIISSSCGKGSDGFVCVPGVGGETELVVYAVHGTDTLRNYASHPDSALLKIGTQDSPGTNPSQYDLIYFGEAGEDHIHITKLNCGEYNVRRTAYDSVTNTTYSGNLGFYLYEISGEKAIYVPVN